MLKKYEELTDEQKKLVYVMYSDQSTVKQYLYNFNEDGKYVGRQYNPPEGETESGIHFGRLHIELEDKPVETVEEKEEVKEEEKKHRRSKKK